jgi:hypothetical protein
MADIQSCIEDCIKKSGGPQPRPARPPSLYFVDQAVNAALREADENPAFAFWLRGLDLNPQRGDEALLGLALAIMRRRGQDMMPAPVPQPAPL